MTTQEDGRKNLIRKNIRENFELSEDELDLVYDIADRYNASSPVSGNWDTETVHEMNAISDELGITPEEARQVMIDYLGFEDNMFNESVKLVEAESMMPDYTGNGSWCIWYYNELDAKFGHDPGPQIVEDNLRREYAEARAEELNESCEPFEQYWAERERERYW